MLLLKNFTTSLIAACLIAFSSVGSALAEKPDWAGQGKKDKHEQKEKHKDKKDKKNKYENVHTHQGDAVNITVSNYFTDPQRLVIRDYYGQQYRAGRCPPGLAKKNNGCMPPGQAKKWAIGQPLGSNVVYYPVPQPVVVQLGIPPVGYKYVRVASDILLIAIGTSLIIDAVQDLGRL
jgi:Ni/Co efflux regulator RcnB